VFDKFIDPSVGLFACLSSKSIHKNGIFSKTKQFRATVFIMGITDKITWAFERTHYWTHKIEASGDLPSRKS